MGKASTGIRIRPVERVDLPVLYEFQLDSAANQMAMTHSRSSDEFDTHWTKILEDRSVVVRAIDVDDQLAGSIACFESDDQHHIGYWIGKAFWGKGIATRALELLLDEVSIRPLYSRVAVTNVASIRVLTKCGFAETGRERSPGTERFRECEEVIMRVDE